MKKSKEFLVKVCEWSNDHLHLHSLLNRPLLILCRRHQREYFGIKVKKDETKRIRITIEEVK